MVTRRARRRQQRLRQREIRLALRSEFEFERPRGWAALRALVRDVGGLERARITARASAIDDALRRPPAPQRTTNQRQ